MNTKKQSKTNSRIRSFFYSWLPTFLWLIVVCYLSLADSGLPKIRFRLFLESDKIAHLAIYFVLTYLLMRSWELLFIKIGVVYLFLLASFQSISFSIIMEVLQKLVTKTRHFDRHDIYANIAGTIIGALFYLLIQKIVLKGSSDQRT